MRVIKGRPFSTYDIPFRLFNWSDAYDARFLA
jgi:hypothetical protein